MPWTRKQVKYLLSSGSPLSSEQREKMVGELHADPSMGHKKKRSADTESHAYDFRKHNGGRRKKR